MAKKCTKNLKNEKKKNYYNNILACGEQQQQKKRMWQTKCVTLKLKNVC